MYMSHPSLPLGGSALGEWSDGSLCHSVLKCKAVYSTLLPVSLEISTQKSLIHLLTLF